MSMVEGAAVVEVGGPQGLEDSDGVPERDHHQHGGGHSRVGPRSGAAAPGLDVSGAPSGRRTASGTSGTAAKGEAADRHQASQHQEGQADVGQCGEEAGEGRSEHEAGQVGGVEDAQPLALVATRRSGRWARRAAGIIIPTPAPGIGPGQHELPQFGGQSEPDQAQGSRRHARPQEQQAVAPVGVAGHGQLRGEGRGEGGAGDPPRLQVERS